MKYYAIIFCALLIVGCGGGSGGSGDDDITISQGEFEEYAFTTNANMSYEIQTVIKNCTSKPCCSLEVVNNQNGVISEAVAGADNIARLVIDTNSFGEVSAIITGLSNSCTYTKPTISAQANTENTQEIITATGQNDTSYDLDITKINNHIYLRDISRRGDNGLKTDALIETTRFVANIHNRENYQSHPHNATSAQSLDKQGVDAHAGSLIVYDYFKNVLDINSFDDKGSGMLAMTHHDFPVVATEFCGKIVEPGAYYNAFWDGVKIAFTPPSKQYPKSFSAALDVNAHEWGHAVIENFTNLWYARESGALNEAFADWIGVAVEHSQGINNWTIGEGAITAFRSLENPKKYYDPDTYKGEYWQDATLKGCKTPDFCENDYCGVHYNSGVANKMFYLLASGGTHNNITVTGIGIDTAIKIGLDAMMNYWTPNTNFAHAKIGMIAAAEDIYGIDSNEAKQVGLAWEAVGVD